MWYTLPIRKQKKELIFRLEKDTKWFMASGENSGIFTPDQEKSFLQKIGWKKITIAASAILLLLGVGGYVFFVRNSTPSEQVNTDQGTPKTETSSVLKNIETPSAPDQIPLFGDANYQSENFRVGDISIGGEAEFLLSEDNPEPLEVNSIRGEAFTEKNKQEVKLVVSWRTNKLAKSTISYSKGVGQAKKSIAEDDYSLNHSVIIPGLDQASTYVYDITSTDRFGNEITSESHAVYTGSRSVSLFDLIANAVGEVFGWAVSSR